MVTPGITCFFGILVYAIGARKEWIGESGKWRWLGVALLLLGAYIGFGPFWNIINSGVDGELYRMSLRGSRKMIFAHWAGFLFPVLCFLGAFAVEFWMRKKSEYDY